MTELEKELMTQLSFARADLVLARAEIQMLTGALVAVTEAESPTDMYEIAVEALNDGR